MRQSSILSSYSTFAASTPSSPAPAATYAKNADPTASPLYHRFCQSIHIDRESQKGRETYAQPVHVAIPGVGANSNIVPNSLMQVLYCGAVVSADERNIKWERESSLGHRWFRHDTHSSTQYTSAWRPPHRRQHTPRTPFQRPARCTTGGFSIWLQGRG